MGHEAVGEVVDAGEGVTSFKQGDRVVASCLFGCGTCARCQEGNLQLCARYAAPMNLMFGCQGEYYVVPTAELNMAKIPDDVNDEAVLFATDIMSTGFGAIENSGLRFGDSVAIFAQGPVRPLRDRGRAHPRRGSHHHRRVVAGARRALEKARRGRRPRSGESSRRDSRAHRRGGVDVAVEALGHQQTLENAVRVTRWAARSRASASTARSRRCRSRPTARFFTAAS